MAVYQLKDRIFKVVEIIDDAQNDLKIDEAAYVDPYSLVAKAVSFSVYQVCEFLIHLEEELKLLTNEIPWKKIHDTRVLIAHFYHKVNMEIIFDIVKNDFPTLKEALLKITNEI